MSKRSQQWYRKAWATQTSLNDFVMKIKRSPKTKQTPKEEPIETSLPLVDHSHPSPSGVVIRQETPDSAPLEFLDREFRQESVTPPPFQFDDDVHESDGSGDPRDIPGLNKRRRSVEIEEVEDEDAPGINQYNPESGRDPESGVECWEEEPHDTIIPMGDIRGWDVLPDQINDDLRKKSNSLAKSHINQLLILRGFAALWIRGVGKMKASEQVALQWQDDIGGSALGFARRIRALARHYQLYEQLPLERRGGYKNARSILKDESVRNVARSWLTSQDIGTVTPQKFCDGLNSEILPGLNIAVKKPICTRTAVRWLIKLGWRKTVLKKGVYMDGHERADVVHYRQFKYLPRIEELQRRMARYEGPNLIRIEPNLAPGEKEIIAVFQDESCFHANEFRTSAWCVLTFHLPMLYLTICKGLAEGSRYYQRNRVVV